ncbi:MAG: hypothetical protein KJ907_01610 [Actinobacteria bacterium]|nr:hypothetical protein [Actinomycetota bacterium]MBU4391869.1 hypothetical protein [Actinomycetota bacterium]MBU4401421.1 hypothetical protein [Actinomycetota bacterium]MBU4442514.1 hypothetical protein [Actinomycetota bacterium]MCG2819858.1 hypothetical protein [Actinomycetes bacterium]
MMRVGVAVCCVVVIVASLLLAGCGKDTGEEYRTEWKTIMDGFFKKLNVDDEKAQKLSEEGDVGGVIQLVNERINGIDDTLTLMMELKPTREYQRLQILTEYFMIMLIDQLEAQNDLNKAGVSGEPTEDLVTKVQNTQGRVAFVGQELSVEQLSVGIVLEDTPTEAPEDSAEPGNGQPTAPAPGDQPDSGVTTPEE